MIDWKPIKTAPKDNSLFLAYVDGRYCLAVYDEDFGLISVDYDALKATHWAELTKPEDNA